MSIANQKITRLYKCTNKDCECAITYKQKVSDKWKKVCPFCRKHSLLLESGNLNISFLIDVKNPVTLGSLGQINQQRKEKEEGVAKPTTPFWRKNKKINYNILKNPKKYVTEGTV